MQNVGTYYFKELDIWNVSSLYYVHLYKPCHECCLRNVKGIIFSLKKN